MDGIVGVVLAAGRGTRLRPLTRLRPKALCPVGNVPLVDLALERVRPAVDDGGGEPAPRSPRPRPPPRRRRPSFRSRRTQPLGTAGALGHLRPLDRRPGHARRERRRVVPGLAGAVRGRVGRRADPAARPRRRRAAARQRHRRCADAVGRRRRRSSRSPPGSTRSRGGRAAEAGRLEVVRHDGPFVDCGTPQEYLPANLLASGGESVVEPGRGGRGQARPVRGVERRPRLRRASRSPCWHPRPRARRHRARLR